MKSLERRLLTKILIEHKIQEFGRLNPKLFVEEAQAYEDISTYLKRYGVLPQAKEGSQEDSPYEFLLDELVKKRLTENIHSLNQTAKDLLEQGRPAEALEAMRQIIREHDFAQSSARELYSMKDMGSAVMEYVQTYRTRGGLVGVPSGWATLDRNTSGFQGGNIYLILARPKKGKSIAIAYMSNYAYEQGYVPLIISMEMKMLEMARRYWAMRAGIAMRPLKEGRISTFAEQKLIEAIRVIEGKQDFYFLEGQFRKTVGELSSIIYALKPHVVFIDGGYLIKLVGQGKLAKWEKVTEIIEDLKHVTITSDIPIVISFQFHREADKKNPKSVGLGNIQLSDAIAQIASVGIGIFEDADERQRLIEIVGGREGESGEFFINWNWDAMDFSEKIEERHSVEGEEVEHDI